jgi:hypothetical protein
VAQQAKSGVGFLIVEVYRSQTISHTHPVRLLYTSDQLVIEAATYTIYKKHKRRTSMPSVGFEPAILATEQPQTHALDHTDTVTHL